MVSTSVFAASVALLSLIPSSYAYWQPPMDAPFQIVLKGAFNPVGTQKLSRRSPRHDRDSYGSGCSRSKVVTSATSTIASTATTSTITSIEISSTGTSTSTATASEGTSTSTSTSASTTSTSTISTSASTSGGTSTSTASTSTPSADPSSVSILDIDLFENSAETIASLKADSKRVICYFSAGTYEPYRTDSSKFLSSDMGSILGDWPDEKWIDFTSSNVKSIMLARLDLAKTKGCDAVDPDNVDGYANDNGLGLTEEQTIEYIQFLSTEAHARGLAIGLKNAVGIIDKVQDFVEFAVNEQCAEYDECDTYNDFLTAGKPVLHIEYPSSAPNMSQAQIKTECSKISVVKTGFNTILKTLDLDGWAAYCDGTIISQ